jgi:hypothetical protein
MNDEPIRQYSQTQRWLQAIAWAYLVILVVMDVVGHLTGFPNRIVPPRFRMALPHVGFVLIILAYRRPGLKGWLLLALALAIGASAIYDY